MGISASLPMFTSYISGFTVNVSYENYGLGTALGIGAFICMVSFLIGGMLVVMEKSADLHDQQLIKNIELLENNNGSNRDIS